MTVPASSGQGPCRKTGNLVLNPKILATSVQGQMSPGITTKPRGIWRGLGENVNIGTDFGNVNGDPPRYWQHGVVIGSEWRGGGDLLEVCILVGTLMIDLHKYVIKLLSELDFCYHY